MQAITQFRLIGAKLKVSQDRHSEPEREFRFCDRCTASTVDEERHAFFFCEPTRLLRRTHALFFEQVHTMQELCQSSPQAFGPVALAMVRLLENHSPAVQEGPVTNDHQTADQVSSDVEDDSAYSSVGSLSNMIQIVMST